MLVQDTLTGAVHEIPQSQLYEADYGENPEQIAEGQMLYDGLGNPVGFSFLKKLARGALRAARQLGSLASLLPIPGAGLLIREGLGDAIPSNFWANDTVEFVAADGADLSRSGSTYAFHPCMRPKAAMDHAIQALSFSQDLIMQPDRCGSRFKDGLKGAGRFAATDRIHSKIGVTQSLSHEGALIDRVFIGEKVCGRSANYIRDWQSNQWYGKRETDWASGRTDQDESIRTQFWREETFSSRSNATTYSTNTAR